MSSRALSIAAATLALLLAAVVTTETAPVPAQAKLLAFDTRAKALLAKMTLAEKIGQMTQPDQLFIKDRADIEKYFFGSVLSGGDSDPKTNTVEDWGAMYEDIQAHALKTRLKIPLLYGVDAVHGHSNVIGAVIFPHHVGLGATRDAKLVEQIGRLTALEVRATGINWAFAPCVAVPRDERWGRAYEGYGEDPTLVAELGEAEVRGMQGPNLSAPTSVLACAKHYVGDGGTALGTGIPNASEPGGHYPLDQGDTQLSEADLRRVHMQGYVTAIRAGVASIMPSYSSWNGEKVSGDKRLMTDILKKELGFEGFLISDYNALDELPGDVSAQIERSINAGMDMVMVPERYVRFMETLTALVKDGKVPMSRIDDAVTRILRVKFAMGLMEPGKSFKVDKQFLDAFGGASHRAVARQAVRESIVVLKNEHNALPLARTAKRIHVAGVSANDLGDQCGGWTIKWQGQSGSPTAGTTVLGAIQQIAGPNVKVTYSQDGTGADGADVAVVVVGETPYAEMLGDRRDLSLSERDRSTIANAKKAGIPVVIVLFSGRPLIINDALAQADAFVAAWLPGTEGLGVADVLFGDYKPSGKLPVSWPRSMTQIPINVGDATYDPLFPYGFGLTY
jgi:beta-glucosidase